MSVKGKTTKRPNDNQGKLVRHTPNPLSRSCFENCCNVTHTNGDRAVNELINQLDKCIKSSPIEGSKISPEFHLGGRKL